MVKYAEYTNVGERDNNEDYIKCIHNEEIGHSFIVADGLGGHGRGEDASRFTVECFENLFVLENDDDESNIDNTDNENDKDKIEENTKENTKENTIGDTKEDIKEDTANKINNKDNDTIKANKFNILNYLKSAFEKAQAKLEEEQDKTGGTNELKTTAVALTINEDKVMWGHIGDSRLYMFNNNKIVIRTFDHSVPQMLVFAGELKDKNIRKHPDRNRLLRVLGARNIEIKIDYSSEYNLDECQAFLLCTDGFWECITERKMCKFLKKAKDVNHWLELMINEVEKNGKGTNMDNNSAIAIWVKDNRRRKLWM